MSDRRGTGRRQSKGDPSSYVSAWTEKDVLGGEVVDSFVVIFRTRGCYWARSGGCTMCGYVNDTNLDVTKEDLLTQLQKASARHENQPVTKVFTSGSFFDEYEVPPEIRREIIKTFGAKSKKVIVETLPHFARGELVEEAVGLCEKLEVAFGLESVTPAVLANSVNKPFVMEHYENACDVVHSAGATVKSYLLIKPPYLTEREAIEDAVSSAEKVAGLTDTISFNPVNIQRGTLVERLWKRGEFRPPWLWSVIEVLERTKGLGARVMSDPTAAGKTRGAHNCGQCDAGVAAAIKDFSLGLRGGFEGLGCDCRNTWLDTLELQGPLQGGVDMDRLLDWAEP